MYHVRRDRNNENYGRKDKKPDASAVKFDGDIAENSDKNEAKSTKAILSCILPNIAKSSKFIKFSALA